MWAPKRQKNGARLVFYDNMREVRPGDVIFSYHSKAIAAVGLALTSGYDCIVPPEFEKVREHWDKNGWRVDVHYSPLESPFSPSSRMDFIAPLLPRTHSPILESGRGNQCYLSEISEDLAQVLGGLIGRQATELLRAAQGELVKNATKELPERAPIKDWEDRIEREIVQDSKLEKTEREALVTARVGQGIFKENVWKVEDSCRVTGVDNPNHLIGSHIRPWRHSSNEERLDGENGLLLTPSIDHLFDKGHISFEYSGALLISPRADRVSLAKMGIKDVSSVYKRPFRTGQRKYLDFHHEQIFLSRTE